MASLFQEISLGGTLGVTFIGVCVSSMLYGVTCLQTFTYYRSPKAKTDSWLLWSLVSFVALRRLRGYLTDCHVKVAALLAFDSAHQAVVIHAVYNYLVLDFANPFKVVSLVWSIPTEVVLNAILALILNGFLTFRLWKLSTRYHLTGIAGVLTLANFGTNLAYAIRGYLFDNIFAAETILRVSPLGSAPASSIPNLRAASPTQHQGIAGLSISVVTESMISFTLAYYLHNRRTGLRK
ncbi:hypothetical protein TRAPUB_7993 [Trametes pubescens]|uniref:Uncharacterized protein n=1 Tax=Trametes pubescens TaxID=154538 RepID=A0A1M2W6H0_TRAPU|nr:hypothetical protein TRAPUB_7993 [Trametes pubescens]